MHGEGIDSLQANRNSSNPFKCALNLRIFAVECKRTVENSKYFPPSFSPLIIVHSDQDENNRLQRHQEVACKEIVDKFDAASRILHTRLTRDESFHAVESSRMFLWMGVADGC